MSINEFSYFCLRTLDFIFHDSQFSSLIFRSSWIVLFFFSFLFACFTFLFLCLFFLHQILTDLAPPYFLLYSIFISLSLSPLCTFSYFLLFSFVFLFHFSSILNLFHGFFCFFRIYWPLPLGVSVLLGVCLSLRLSVCEQNNSKDYNMDFHKTW